MAIVSYPILSASSKVQDEGTGVTQGKSSTSETTKKIWTAAEERTIENTVTNRELAYSIDPLVRHIVNTQRLLYNVK